MQEHVNSSPILAEKIRVETQLSVENFSGIGALEVGVVLMIFAFGGFVIFYLVRMLLGY